MTNLGFILVLMLNDLQTISGTFSPTLAPIIDQPRDSVLVNGTSSPENVTICFPIFNPCINPRILLSYIPIDYDGLDEPNEFIRVLSSILLYTLSIYP